LSTASLVNVLMVALISRRPPPVLQLGAAVTGLAGVGLIFLPELQLSPTVGLALLLGGLGTLSFCIGNLMSAASQKRNVHVLASTSWGMVYGTAFMVIVSLIRGHEFTIDPSVTYIGSLIWLVSISSVLAFASYLTLIGRIGPGRAGYATVIFPVIALLISTIFEGYVWAPLSFVGLALVMAGNVMMIRARD
ncbi:MAG: EamA family transporter, partial [Alphaproteobacteria bacterium]